MAERFENPANGYTEEVSSLTWLWALLFGWIYLLVKGLWGHVALQLAIIVMLALVTDGPGALIAVPLWLLYAFITPGLLRAKYLRAGWRQARGSHDYPPA